MKMDQIKPVSYLKKNTSAVINEVRENGQPVIITQNGEASAVIIDAESYQQQQALMALLKVLAIGNRHVEQGETEAAEDVFEKLKQRLKESY